MKIFFILFFSLSIFSACSKKPSTADLNKIKELVWVYKTGVKLSLADDIEFADSSAHELRKDSVFERDNKYFVGRIIKYDKKKGVIEIRTSIGLAIYSNHQLK